MLAPTLALELLRVADGQDSYIVRTDDHGVWGVQLGKMLFPTDPDGRLRLYFSKPDPRRRISALHALQGTVPADRVQDTIAIIGVTALGLVDVRPTPVAAHMDGGESQEQALENILSNTRLVRPPWASWLELLAFVVSALLLIAILPHVRPVVGVALVLARVLPGCTGVCVR